MAATEGEDEALQFTSALQAVARQAFLLVRSQGRAPQDAADVVQDAAVQAWRYRKTRRGDFRPWFLSIVYRRARRPLPAWITIPILWRADHGADEWHSPASSFDPDLAVAINRLPSRQRTALWLRYGEDMTTADAAAVMGVGEEALKQLVFRARTAVRRQLGELRGELRDR